MDDITPRPSRGDYTRRQQYGRPVPARTPQTSPQPLSTTETTSTIRPAQIVPQNTAEYSEQTDFPQQPGRFSKEVRAAKKAVRKRVRHEKKVARKTVQNSRPPKNDRLLVIRLPKWVARVRRFAREHKLLMRVSAGALALLMIFAFGYEVYMQRYKTVVYNFTGNETNILSQPSQTLAQKLQYDVKTGTYEFNKGYSAASNDVASSKTGPKITASFGSNSDKSVKITDPASSVSITLKPRFALAEPKQDANRIVYPMIGKHVSAVYSLGSIGVKEDLLIRQYQGDKLDFDYDLNLPDGVEARTEKDGSIGVYGVQSALLGNVTTSSDKDAELLQKARQNGAKTQLLFNIPAPILMDGRKQVSKHGKASYRLDGKVLTVHAEDLRDAVYPLSIDPTVYVASAVQFMRGNNETNVDFDPTLDLIQKSQTTGARIDSWTSTSNLSTPVWGQGTAVAGGYIYTVGGDAGNSITTVTFSTAGSSGWQVPAGITSLSVKVVGAGGGGGNGSGSTGVGGNGAGAALAKTTLTVTPLTNLTIEVGTGGAAQNGASDAGNGGGYSSIKNGSTYLIQAGGGGGGGGTQGSGTGRAGGVGGGTTGTGGTSGTGGGGGGGQAASGGTAGTAGTGGSIGSAGSANTGGAGGGGSGTTGTGNGGNGGTTGSGGGGGGGGAFGGGGGGSSSAASNRRGGGGGGGSSIATGTGPTFTAGSGQNSGGNSDPDIGTTAGKGGSGSAAATGATSGGDGKVVISYTTSGTGLSQQVSWAKFNPTTNAIMSPTPGNSGACSGWCTNSVYNLPTALRGLSLVAYNGYLYALGGSTAGGAQTKVYIAKLGANGEPQLWHPSGGTPVYWYEETTNALTNARSYFGAVAYNNKLYILGGLTTSNAVLSSNTVQSTDILPTGGITAWTTTGMSAMSGTSGGNRYGLTAQVYNDTLYVIGGDATFTGTPVANVDYSKLNSDGTMNSWVQTGSLQTSGRLSMGGSFSTIFAGYIYVGGGCTAVNASGYCTTIASDVQLASINADGSLAGWNTVLNLTNARIGHTLVAWQGGLYRLGGCRTQDTGTGACSDTALEVDFGVINEEGEASTVANSVPSGTAPCSGTTPYGCDLPGISIIGNVLNGSAVLNGYLYIWGGCSNNTSGCGTVSRGVIFTSIGSDGSLTKPATCGSWTAVDSYCYNTTSLPGSVGAPGTAVFNGYLYSVGGFTAGGATNSVYYAAPSTTDGTISSWSTASLTGIGGTSVSYPYSFARANPGSAGSTPGNLYILGGCSGPAGIGCSNYTDAVYKCTLSTAGVPAACSTNPGGSNQQLQIGVVPGDTVAGLGAMAGTLYANYIYLMGGLTPNQTDIKTTRYAKIDNNNNIVDATTGSGSGSWTESSNLTFYGRRRGAGFGYNGYLYVVGGYDGSGGGGGVLADIEFAKINVSDGSIGGWTVSSVNINQRWGLSVRVSNSYAYVIGGCISGAAPTCNAAGQTNSIQTFQIYNNDSGAVQTYTSSAGNFAASTDRWGASSTILNGYLYVAGGCTSATDCSTATGDIQYALISTTDGSIGSWNTATKGIGDSGSGAQVRAWGRLVAAGGYLYYLGGQNSAGTAQNTVYYAQPSSGNISSNWATATKGIGDTGSGAVARTKFGAAVWDNRIYVVGGLDTNATSNATNTVFVSPQLNAGGNISSNWASSTAFNIARYGAAITAYANNIYVFGGIDNSGNYLNDGQFVTLGYKTGTISQSGTTLTGSGTTWTSAMVGSTVQYADGSRATISAFSSTTSLTVSVSKTVTAGSIYTIQDGSLGSWSYTTSIPGKIAQAEAFGANGYIYLVGGRSAASSCSPKTLFAPVSANTLISSGNNPTGVGDWSETNVRYAGGRYGAAVAYGGGKIYVMGGGCTRPQNGTYSTGTIGQTTTTITGAGGASFSDDLIGGTITYQDASTATIVAVTDSTHLVSSVSKTVTAGQTYSIAVARHYYATVKSQPQVAKYSRMIDTDTDVFPNAWLMNGIDNAIGARWQLKYKSMHDVNPLVVSGSDSVKYDKGTITQSGTTTVTGTGTTWTASMVGSTLVYADATTTTVTGFTNATTITVAGTKTVTGQNYAIWTLQQNPNEDCGTSSSMAAMTTWGQETNVGNVYTGDVAPYTAKNGSGSNINCARYFYFNISIDVSQTYGYPEDVNRGPTISDISLLFTSDPSKRLRHGATFTGGELQPLDTPCRQTVDADCPLP